VGECTDLCGELRYPLLAQMAAPFTELRPDWLPVAEALERIQAHGTPLPPATCTPSEALGRILGESVDAAATLPPFDNSAMDGYAVRAEDIRGASANRPVRLRVIAAAPAGAPTERSVEPGTAIRIMTGAPVPTGADSVVRVEHTDREAGEGVVEIRLDGDAGRNIRPAGRDFREGDRLLEAGSRMTPSAVGLATAGGARTLQVQPAPKVTVVPTGDELVGPEDYDRVRQGRGIPDTNGPMIAAAVRSAGGTPLRLTPARDDLDALARSLEEGLGSDVLITIGGASMGTGDLVKRALERHGFELEFWRVLMRPGSPFGFGLIPREGNRPLPVLSLPGNPASAFVTFELFGRPLIRALAGEPEPFRPSVTALAAERFGADPKLTLFPRVALESDETGGLHALSNGSQSSGLVRGLSNAHGLAVIPPMEGPLPAGTPIQVMLLADGAPGSSRPRYLDSPDE